MNKFIIIFALCVSFMCFKTSIETKYWFFEWILSFLGSWNLINVIIMIKKKTY